MKLAELTANMSKDPSTKVGAVIARPNKTICSVGFNGLPSKIPDYSEYLTERNLKLKVILHAEENAILNSNDNSLMNYSIYIHGLPPCPKCTSIVIQSGIKNIYYYCEEIPERYKENYQISKELCKISDVKIKRLLK